MLHCGHRHADVARLTRGQHEEDALYVYLHIPQWEKGLPASSVYLLIICFTPFFLASFVVFYSSTDCAIKLSYLASKHGQTRDPTSILGEPYGPLTISL
jgi:hypothetical protein